jgi:broad specificity phosphatase PhoE
MKRIILVRHAESIKNINDKHGGLGLELTQKGVSDVNIFASDFEYEIDEILIVPRKQCEQTAEIISRLLSLDFNPSKFLSPFYLGVLDGLSKEEAKLQYPCVANRLEQWRSGLLDISELNIPESSCPEDFYECLDTGLKNIMCISNTVMIIGTRSVLVGLWNVLHNYRPQHGGNYREVPWCNMGFAIFETVDSEGDYSLSIDRRS